MESKQQNAYLSDEQIIDLYFAREERAIAETDRKYCQYLHTVAYNILANEQDSEECLQDTYLRAWNTIPPERPKMLLAFLSKITRNLSLNRYKAAKRQKRVPGQASVSLDELSECVSGDSDPVKEMQAAIVAQVINRYLDSIPERRMYVFVARYFYSLSIPQIAKRLSCSPTLVHREIDKIRKELRQCLQKEGLDT